MFAETKYRRDIQVLRGLAVLAVVLFHANESYFPAGYFGVDVFFVISGFVVTPLILQIFTDQANGGRFANLRYFYKRRFYRLAPALGSTLAFSAVAIFLLCPPTEEELLRFTRQGIATLLLLGNIGAYRYTGDYFSTNPNPLFHTWSLSVEEQIYVFLPLLLMLILANRRSLKRSIGVVLGFISVISLISFLFPVLTESLYSRIGTTYSGASFAFYSPIDRVWQFTLGGLGFLLLDRYKNRITRFSVRTNTILIIALAIILFGPIHLNLKVSSIVATLFALFVILFKSLESIPNALTQKLEWIGDRSYSIYLVHMPLLYIAKYSPVTQIGNSENQLFQSTIAVFASIFFGALSYSKVENRFRNRAKIKTIDVKTISAALIISLVIPLVFLVGMDRGLKNQYWGLDRNVPRPPVAWGLDPDCIRIDSPEPCLYMAPTAERTVLLIGDSHAGHISQAVVDAASNTNWNAAVWTTSGCHMQFQITIKDQVSEQCLMRNRKILKWIERSMPTAIIVSQYVYSDSSQIDLRNGLSTLRSVVPNILLIENNPIFPDEKDFMMNRPIVMSPYLPPKVFTKSVMQIKDKSASNQLAKWAQNNGISVMNFDSIFCTTENCKRYSDAGWLYRDADHLSVAGAALTIPQLSSYLKRI